VRFARSSGILLHPTSLPGRYGIGELGGEAYAFADFLHSAGQKIWQVLPLNPTGYGDSPYQCFSAFAGNPLLISLETLREEGWLSASDLTEAPALPDGEVDFGAVIRFKFPLLRKAARSFLTHAKADARNAFDKFCRTNAGWLDDFALFMALKEAHEGVVWTKWPTDLVDRDPSAMQNWRERLREQIAANKFWQYEFFRQWCALKSYCNERGIRIMGDVPIYVAHDSADVWANPELFCLDAHGNPEIVAGVPPDYFSATGQLWGNPIYRWDVLKEGGYKWWIERFRGSLMMFDLVRLDHFRGFEAHWEIPAGEKTAVNGRWVKGPGADLFRVLQNALGELPLVAENLGVITPEVENLRKEFGFPGMAILQFAFGIDAQAPSFRPHNYKRDTVAYTGTHDNDTAIGWWTGGAGNSVRTQQDVETEHAFAKAYLGFEDEPINWVLIRHVMMSVAETALMPLQDVLGLGSESRMNLPGSFGRNWKWRFAPEAIRPWMAEKLREMVELYDR
jgi:4-alpha-glucanotransferase